MNRSPTVVSVALVATTLLALTPIATRWGMLEEDLEILRPVGGHLEVAVAEQDVGLVGKDEPLEVCFVVGNSGQQRLLVRQTSPGRTVDQATSFTTYSVSPGQRVAVTAHLEAADVAPQGVAHVLFLTSDPSCPRLWFSVRGSVRQH